MKTRIHSLAAAAFALAAFTATGLVAQDLHPSRRPSPLGMSRVTLGDTYVRIVGSRPYKRDRDNIFGTKESGALVPFDERWRTGANEATELTVTSDVLVAGQRLKAGTYSLFTTPGAESWKVHVNSTLGLDGLGWFNRETSTFTAADLPPADVLTVEVTPATLAEDAEVDQMTFSFEKTDAGADLVLRWIRTEIRVPIAVAD